MPGRMPKGQFRLYRRLHRVIAVSSVVRTAKMRGDYSLGMPEIRLQPWLFQGHAGIAWALAHIAAPDRLPSILTFQLPTNEPG